MVVCQHLTMEGHRNVVAVNLGEEEVGEEARATFIASAVNPWRGSYGETDATARVPSWNVVGVVDDEL